MGGGIGVGSSEGSITHDVYLDNVNASSNTFNGLTLGGVNGVFIENSKFSNNVGIPLNPSTTFNGVWGILATPLLGSGIASIDVTIVDTEMSGNTSDSGAVGFESVSIPSLPHLNLPYNENINIIRCEANTNMGGGTTNPAVNEGEGIVLAGTNNFVVADCIAQGNMSLAPAPTGIAGNFVSVGFGVPFDSLNGSFINCVAQGNSGNADLSAGFRVTGSNTITFTNCKAYGHTNDLGEAWGFTTDTNVGNPTAFGSLSNTNFVFDNCVAENNISTADPKPKRS